MCLNECTLWKNDLRCRCNRRCTWYQQNWATRSLIFTSILFLVSQARWCWLVHSLSLRAKSEYLLDRLKLTEIPVCLLNRVPFTYRGQTPRKAANFSPIAFIAAAVNSIKANIVSSDWKYTDLNHTCPGWRTETQLCKLWNFVEPTWSASSSAQDMLWFSMFNELDCLRGNVLTDGHLWPLQLQTLMGLSNYLVAHKSVCVIDTAACNVAGSSLIQDCNTLDMQAAIGL